MDEIKEQQGRERQKRYTEFLQSINCCPLCGEPLTLIHEVNEEDGFIEETAHCSNCKVDTRRKDHPIQ